ncbi:hypothetical protein AVEN_223590-1 [Araneus ventricosus]|uniref:Uncharacterized protein n=1 Tax=Araneus ventricosus TaxID=182803 RepID=A0A4Y2HKC4_ARAVE|nr:hypothetical protein AVEN_223590-1 [Araneus ventricosus]
MCHLSSLLPVKVIEGAASTEELAGILKFLPRYCNKYEELVKSTNQSSVLPSSISDLPGPIEETAFISVPEVQSSSGGPVSTSNTANLWVEFVYAKP